MIFDLIKKRRSIFPAQYIEKSIAKADIEKILEAANWAPNHKKTEPWRFKVLQGEKKAELGQFLSDTYINITPKPKQIKAKISTVFISQKCSLRQSIASTKVSTGYTFIFEETFFGTLPLGQMQCKKPC